MKRNVPALVLAFTVAAVAPAFGGSSSSEGQKFEKSFSFEGDKDIKVGVKYGDVTIDSFRIRHWPDPDDFRKAEKDLTDKHSAWVDFHYSNRDRENSYKCRYVVAIPGGKDGKPFAEADRTATLDKGKIDDTNKVGFKMYTSDYKAAKTIKISFEIWKK